MSTNFEQGLDVEGNVNLTGNIIVGGNTVAGDANTDNVTFNADVSSDIIPDVDKTYSLGTITKRWDNIFGDALNLESGLSAASAVVTTSVTAEEFISTSTGTPTLSSGSDIIINPTGQVNVTSDIEVTGNLLVQGVLSNLLNWSIVESSGVLTFVNSVSGNTVTLPDVTDTLATQAYVNQQITAENLDFAGDTGGTLEIDLDSEVLTIAGGTGIDTVGSGNTLTISVDSTIATQAYVSQQITTDTAGLASELYVQNYVAANAGGGGGGASIAAAPEVILTGLTQGSINLTGVEDGQVVVTWLADHATSNTSTFMQIWDQDGWVGFNPSSTVLANTTNAHIRWANTTGVTKDVYIRGGISNSGGVGRIVVMKFGADFDGDYNSLTGLPTLFSGAWADLTGKPTIPTDLGDLTDNGGLLNSGGGGGFITGGTLIGGNGTQTALSFNTPVTVQNGQTIFGWSSDTNSGSQWYDNYQGSVLNWTNYGNPYTNNSGGPVVVYGRCSTTNSQARTITYQIFG